MRERRSSYPKQAETLAEERTRRSRERDRWRGHRRAHPHGWERLRRLGSLTLRLRCAWQEQCLAELDHAEEVSFAVLEVRGAAELGDRGDPVDRLHPDLRQVVLLEGDPAGAKLGHGGVDVVNNP